MLNFTKVHYCINPEGFHREIGGWLIASIRSVLANTTLQPVVLYSGHEDNNTALLRKEGAQVILFRSRILPDIEAKLAQGKLPARAEGALLRYEIPSMTDNDEYALYADCDTYFIRTPSLSNINVPVVGAVLTPSSDDKPHYNSGILVFNVAAFRAEEIAFFSFLRETLGRWLPASVDEIAFNTFFREKITSLPREMNWRPMFGHQTNVDIVHFHGFKLAETILVLQGDFRGKDRAIFESNYVYELASHSSKTLPSSMEFISSASESGFFVDTALEDLILKIRSMTTPEKLLQTALMARSELAQVAYHGLKAAKLSDIDTIDTFCTSIHYDGNQSNIASFKLHPCKNFGAGKISIISTNGNFKAPIQVIHNTSLMAEISKSDSCIEISWCGAGMDSHFIFYQNDKSIGDESFTVEIKSIVHSPAELFSQDVEGNLMAISKQKPV